MGSNSAEEKGLLRMIKIHSKPSFRGEVKASTSCLKTLQNLKNPFKV
jgi:hypothetical protein